MRVLIIDPWCSDDYEVYTIGLCDGLSKVVDTTLISAFHESRKNTAYRILPVFFKRSDQMKKRGTIRAIVRGLEYIMGYFKVLRHVKKEKYDVIHIEWALSYKIDYFFDRILRKRCSKLVYTAHNVIPHINGDRFIPSLRLLHKNFDAIVVHGETIRQEYLSLFPEDKQKVFIQRHGVHLTQKTIYDINNVDKDIVEFIEGENHNTKIVACVGVIYYNKGTDRVIKYWKTNETSSNNKLIVAGKVTASYSELEKAIDGIPDNVLFLPRYLNDDEYAYVLHKTDIVTIPYRDASMSGIVYSAAAFSKPIVYTDTGSLKEYVGDDCGFVASNSDDDFSFELSRAISLDKKSLVNQGSRLHERIYNNFNWNAIGERLVKEVYGKE